MAVQTNPGVETYVLNAMFNSVQPLPEDFVEINHALSITSQQCTNTKFAGDQTGIGVLPSVSRSLWLEFKVPTSTAITTPQNIRLVITAEAS